MRYYTAAFLFSSLALAQDKWQTRLTKPAIHPNLDFVEQGLQVNLPEISFTATKWNNNLIPKE